MVPIMKPALCRALSLIAAACFALPALAQSATTPAASTKPLAFEVVSIRPSNPGTNRMFSWVTTPDGYRVSGQSIFETILMAYYPQGMAYWPSRVQNSPGWTSDLYDIQARVSGADLAAWQKQGLALDQKPMLREMLQTMLADRCKLTFHRVPDEITGYALVAAKRGPRLKEAKPGATLPVGVKFPDGGIAVGYQRGQPAQWSYYSATTSDLVSMLSLWSLGRPVVDRTGLAGHYDFVLRCGETDTDHPLKGCATSTPDLILQWDWASLGLRLVPIKIPIDNLVIDHIEKPSPN